MEEEFQAHLDGLAESFRAQGMSEQEARQAARREFGGVDQLKEQVREQRRFVWLEQLLQDTRHAVRSLTKAPSFTITAVLTLAFGIGVNAALFSLYNMVALRPLPVKDPERLVTLSGLTSRGEPRGAFTYAEYLAYREGNRSLDGLLALRDAKATLQSQGTSGFGPGGPGGESGVVPITYVSGNFFEVIGGKLRFGRGFLPEDFQPGAPPVMVLSQAYWEHFFQGDPNIVGTRLNFRDQPVTVIGVTVAGFSGHTAASPAGWLPLGLLSTDPADYEPGGPSWFRLIGRLKPGVQEAQAKADLDLVAATWAREFPDDEAKESVYLKRGLYFMNIPPTAENLALLSPLILGFGMVLLIACTNVANLLLARGISRQSEIGIRLALGAGRGRIVRQLLTENVLLCISGALLGLGMGIWVIRIIQPMLLAPIFPATWMMSIKPIPDFRVLGFTAVLTIGASLVAGLVPALHTARSSLVAAANRNGMTWGAVSPTRLRRWLVMVQVAVCMMLLSCAGLLARNVFAPHEVDRGFDPHRVFGATVKPNPEIADREEAFRQALATVRTIPGVEACGVANPPPYELVNQEHTDIRTEEAARGGTEAGAPVSFASGHFFQAYGVPLQRGRTFREIEHHSEARAVIISESLARRLWPGLEAVGRTLAVSETAWAMLDRPALEGAFRECEVIGVVRDAILQHDHQSGDQIYLPFPLDTPLYAAVYIRPQRVSAAALEEITREADARGIGLHVHHPQSRIFEQVEMANRGMAILGGALGLLALVMASVGLYGLMTFAVNQRVREIGIRMALGATMERVVGLFVRQGMRMVGIGLAVGLLGGALFALLLEKMLFGLVDAFDPAAFAVVMVIFTLIALFTCWLPARRAARVDPMKALRCE